MSAIATKPDLIRNLCVEVRLAFFEFPLKVDSYHSNTSTMRKLAFMDSSSAVMANGQMSSSMSKSMFCNPYIQFGADLDIKHALHQHPKIRIA